MKYKNYRNAHTNDNRIYSFEELYGMPLKDIHSKEKELLAQYDVLGIPKEKELRGSENVIWVEEYTRDDGTEVKGHWRSKPNSGVGVNAQASSAGRTVQDKGNSEETSTPADENGDNETKNEDKESIRDKLNKESEEKPSEDQEIENLTEQKSYTESEEYKVEYCKREKQKSIERKDPAEVAGVKLGEPKTFWEMMQQGVNPNYESKEDVEDNYSKNCQSCNVACEVIIRGGDVEANPYDNPIAKELAKVDNSAYLDPKTGEKCIPEIIDVKSVDCADYINKTVKKEERYEFGYNITLDKTEPNYSTGSHTVFMTRLDNGELLIYDGQNGEIAYGEKEVKLYIDSRINSDNTYYPPRLLRVDDKQLNPYYANAVVRACAKN